MTAARVIAAARAAGIVDAGAAGGGARPLAERLRQAAARGVSAVVGCAVDAQPLVSTGRRLAAARASEVAAGLAHAVAAVGGTARGVIAVEARADEARAALTKRGLEVRVIADVAGAAEPADIARDAVGCAVGVGEDPLDHGVLLLDVAALVDLAAAAASSPPAPVVDRWLTIAGDVARPGVRRVPIGTPVADLVAAAGGATCGEAWVALAGGPLVGWPLDRDAVVTKGMRALFVTAGASDLARRARTPLADQLRRSLSACERCAVCSGVCPTALRPDRVLRAIGGAHGQLVELMPALDCTGCGLCDVACPVGLSPRALVLATARSLADHQVAREGRTGAPAPQRLSLGVVGLRLGLGEDPPAPAWDPEVVAPSRVSIPLKQSLGVPAIVVVSVGQRVVRGARIADVAADVLGVPMHASITGVVSDIADGCVVIEGERA